MNTLEERVAALEQQVAELTKAQKPKNRLLEPRAPMTEQQMKMMDEIDAYGRYWRKTDREPPDDWKPSDPIPEPDGVVN